MNDDNEKEEERRLCDKCHAMSRRTFETLHARIAALEHERDAERARRIRLEKQLEVASIRPINDAAEQDAARLAEALTVCHRRYHRESEPATCEWCAALAKHEERVKGGSAS